MIDRTLAAEAVDLVTAQRQGDYGDPAPMHAAIGAAWTGILHGHLDGHTITASEAALMLAALKLVRLSVGGWKRDSAADALAYVLIADHCRGAQ